MAGKGDAMNDLWWLIIILIAGGVLWFMRGGPQKFQSGGGVQTYLSPPDIGIKVSTTSGGRESNSGGTQSAPAASSWGGQASNNQAPTPTVNPNDSRYKGQIYLEAGSASYGDNSSQEYVYVKASSDNKAPVTISGWQLKNNEGEIHFNVNGQNVPGQTTAVSIPQGTSLQTFHNDPLGPIVLKPGETAVIITGNPPSVSPQISQSFRVNECSGYIDRLPYHGLTPSLYGNCPDIKTEGGIGQLSQDCYDFINYHYGSNCHTPNITQDSNIGELYDNQSLAQYCKNYIIKHFSYDSCVVNHRNDKDFYKSEWYVYLFRVWPLWNNNKEKITLLDNYGKVVDQISYGY